ncbi:MAG: L,D-transpeptidase family protein [Hyphomicrobiales bacterium]
MTETLANIQVMVENISSATGQLQAGRILVPCALGRGVTHKKREGDGKTPLGTWPLREVFYRADKTTCPSSGLKSNAIAPDDGWCDDPTSEDYNLPVKLPYAPSHEKMWRDDHLYDLVIPLGYNDAPPMPGMGSAIFFHLAHGDYRPTEGCVAISLEHMRLVLPLCAPQTVMTIALSCQATG